MALIDFHDVDELKNRNEEKVWAAVEAHLAATPQACRCRDCILDTAAIALNRLPPRYQVYSFHDNHPGEEAALEGQVQEAVAAAAAQVAQRPHHF
ncbi:MAG TPA: late competence development ComFB family protein [Candidatus Methanoperedens sp.]|nr:late competence development ComFB family protein [Candidatus Methanoperedens sp.]